MEEFLDLTVLGLCTASIYALAASGLVLTYTTTGIFNFAHGAIGMLGAFAFWELHAGQGWPIPIALAVVLLVLAPLLGVVIERLIMRHLTDAPETVRIVVTISLLVALLGLGLWAWPSDEAHPAVQLFRGKVLDIVGVGVSWHRASAVVVALVVAVALRALLFRTRVGLDMRAAVDSRPLALLHGARPDRSAALAWAIGSSLAALAGILIAPVATMNHIALTVVIVSAYAAAVFGRLRSFPMTFVGALVLGLLESYAIGYIDSGQQYFSTFRFVIAPIVLAIVLLALPSAQLRTRTGAASKEDIPRPSWIAALSTAAAIIGAAFVLANILSDGDSLRAAKILGLATIALSLVPLTGFGGQVSLCQMSFAGIGAIVMGHHGGDGNPATLLLVAAICAVVGALVALPSLRLSGLYLALSTAAFAVFLDRWAFSLRPFDLTPWAFGGDEPIKVQLFGTVLPVPSLDIPGVDDSSRPSQVVVTAVVFSLLYLVVIAVRRSGFGDRLLAMKDSPAACATIGINVTALKLAVFSLSAAIAGIGGAVYASTLGSVSADRFSLFESLSLLLLSVVGGIGTAGGALFAGIILGGLPIAIAIWPFLASLNRLLPGTMGVALGRNPNGAVHDIASRYAVVGEEPFALAGLVTSVVIAGALAATGSITGWALTFALVAALVVWPQAAELAQARRRPREAGTPLEWLAFDRPLTAEELRDVDAALGLDTATEEVSATALEVSDLSVSFGGRLALDEVTLTAEPGIVTGLIGPNGAGKTTLFNVVCGLLPPARGRVRIDGHDVTRLAPYKRSRRGLARTFQRLEPFGLLTVRENVRLAASAAHHDHPDSVAGQLLEQLRITALADVRADRLPTGQARVVELARALATAPKVLLLDEPASGQDEQETATFSAIVRDVAADGVAVVLVEHDIQLVMGVCTRIDVLDLGRVLASGTPREVRENDAVLSAYLGAGR